MMSTIFTGIIVINMQEILKFLRYYNIFMYNFQSLPKRIAVSRKIGQLPPLKGAAPPLAAVGGLSRCPF